MSDDFGGRKRAKLFKINRKNAPDHKDRQAVDEADFGLIFVLHFSAFLAKLYLFVVNQSLCGSKMRSEGKFGAKI